MNSSVDSPDFTEDGSTTTTTTTSATTPGMPPDQQVRRFLANCNLSQYSNTMIHEGFDQLEALLEVTEQDLEQMGVKRGHRRLLQRAISNARRLSSLSLLFSNQNPDYFGSSDHPERAGDPTRDQLVLLTPPTSHASAGAAAVSHRASVSSMSTGAQTSSSNDEDMVTSENLSRVWKRKYRRHAKADDNAPKKPLSAYVMFSNEIRVELKDQNLSFTTLSKVTGDRWKKLSPNERKFYEIKAAYAKQDYAVALAKYELTDEHKQYQQYLSEFRMRHESAVAKPGKRSRSTERRADMSPSESIFIPDPPSYPTDPYSIPNSPPRRPPDPAASSNEARIYPYWLLNDNANDQSASHPSSSTDVIYPNPPHPES
ncbi:hypothetical protein BJV82DRAFT_617570 [Fennellomyces sp. T-0311]|nr:hypothetical protein BJV82DRAFT_617570 [Fennellomyces sp. T-0311]